MDSRAELIDKIIFQLPQRTTYVAHQLTNQELSELVSSSSQVARLFGHICYFARGVSRRADKFSKDLLDFMQCQSASADQSKYCVYFYTKAQHYLPEPLPNSDQIDEEYKRHASGIARYEKLVDARSGVSAADPETVVYKWLNDIEISSQIADMLKRVQAVKPYDYKEQISNGWTLCSTKVGDAWSAYARPLAQSISTYSTSLFTHDETGSPQNQQTLNPPSRKI